MEVTEQVIQQTILVLLFFDEEVPLVCLFDGLRYIPVIALCERPGLRADTHIPRWRHLMLWRHTRKPPWRAPTGRIRIVWCLDVGAIPLWSNSFSRESR